MNAVASGADLEQLLAGAVRDRAACWVLSATGRVVGGTGELAEAERHQLVRYVFSAEQLPSTFRFGTRPYVVCPVDAAEELRASRWFLVQCGDQQDLRDPQEQAADLSVAVALLRTRSGEAVRVVGRSVEVALRRSAEGAASISEIAPAGDRRLAHRCTLRVVALTVQVRQAAPMSLLREILAATGIPPVPAG